MVQACGYVSVMREMLVRFVQTQFPTKKNLPEGPGACSQQPCAHSPALLRYLRKTSSDSPSHVP